jgi:prepilin-type N-terminal cleavage/methylation domain-containing protein
MFFRLLFSRHHTPGFTLLEILLVVSILAIVTTVGIGVYRNLAKRVEFEDAKAVFISDMKHARAAAMSGESGLSWGIHVENGADDTYAIFSGLSYASGTIDSTMTLPVGVTWVSPSEGTSTDIVFSRVTGTTTAATVTMASGDTLQTITITAVGHVY